MARELGSILEGLHLNRVEEASKSEFPVIDKVLKKYGYAVDHKQEKGNEAQAFRGLGEGYVVKSVKGNSNYRPALFIRESGYQLLVFYDGLNGIPVADICSVAKDLEKLQEDLLRSKMGK